MTETTDPVAFSNANIVSGDQAGTSLADTETAAASANFSALFEGLEWPDTSLTYSFPQSEDVYPENFNYSYSGEQYTTTDENGVKTTNFRAINTAGQAVFSDAFDMFNSVSGLTLTQVDGDADADIRVGGSTVPSTAWAYSPGYYSAAGDIWVNTTKSYNRKFYEAGKFIGTYEFNVAMHELGHALGLKHPHASEAGNPETLDLAFDSLEYTVMSYRSYTGDPTAGSYTNERWGYPQSLMMLDVAAIQELYGADYTSQSGDNVYKFDVSTGEMFIDGVSQGQPGVNRVFRNIWDGDGNDTLDLSDYSTNLSIDLRAGGTSDFDVGGNFQRARLANGIYAANHLTMSLLFEGNTQSLIEGAIGGSGNDVFVGNEADNWFNGGLGQDTYTLGAGSDTVEGTLAELEGDTITDFGVGDRVIVDGDELTAENITTIEASESPAPAAFSEVSPSLSIGLSLEGGIIQVRSDGAESVISYADQNTISLTGMADSYHYAGVEDVTVITGSGQDYVSAGSGNDTIIGGEGGDVLRGKGGDDILNGGAGANRLEGGSGKDTFVYDVADYGSGANYSSVSDFTIADDTIVLDGFGIDSFANLSFNDVPGVGLILSLGSYGGVILEDVDQNDLTSDHFDFTSPVETFFTIAEEGVVRLSESSDLFSYSSEDVAQEVHAGGGNDAIYGGSQGDVLYGDAGGDILLGNGGDDKLFGGAGSDKYYGGAGEDHFVILESDSEGVVGSDYDAFEDFVIGEDTIELSGFGISSLDGVSTFSLGTTHYVMFTSTQAMVFSGFDDVNTILDATESFLFT